jgi:hypothetical protein
MNLFQLWCLAERESLRQQVELLLAEKVALFEAESDACQLTDLTQVRVHRVLERLEEIELLISQFSPSAR